MTLQLPEGMRLGAAPRDITNQRFGRLVALEVVGKAPSRSLIWRCRCDCGAEVDRRSASLHPDKIASCGCYLREINRARFIGQRPWNAGKTYQIKGDDIVYRSKKAWTDAVIRRRGNECEECGWAEAACDVHHAVPRSKGGRNTITNAVVLCPNHHRVRHSK